MAERKRREHFPAGRFALRRRILIATGLLFGLTALLWGVTGSQITFTLGTTPGNPSSGKIRLWSNTASGFLECLTSGGADCMSVNQLNGTSLKGLATGLLKNTTSTGVPSIATGTDICGLLTLTGDVTSSAGCPTTVVKLNGTSLAGLATGILKNTTSTGVPSIATAGTDYLAPCTTTITTGTSATLSTCFTVNQESTAATGVAYTLPTAASGLQFCIDSGWNGSAANTGILTLNASASGQYLVFTDGTLSASGGNVTSAGAARDGACVYGIDSTHWMFLPHSGTWTNH